MTDIVIAAAARTPIGSFSGALASVPAHTLGEIALRAAMERAKLEPGAVSDVILGQILSAGEGQNAARQAAVAAGIPYEKTAITVNQGGGPGLRAVGNGVQVNRHGRHAIVL